MFSLVCIWSLVFSCGVLSESPTYPSNDGLDSTTSEPSTFSTENYYSKYSSLLEGTNEYEDWKPYSPDVYPLFRKAVKELASSERGILIFWESLNRPEPPRAFYEQVFRAYDRMVDDVPSSTTTEEDNETTLYNSDSTESDYSELESAVLSRKERVDETEEAAVYYPSTSNEGDAFVTTLYNLDSTEPDNSEFESDILSRKERVDETEESAFDQPISSEGDVVDVYYSEDNPEVDVVVLEDSYYTSSIAPEQDGSKDLETMDLYEDSIAGAEIKSDAESNVAASEIGVEDILRRSGILVEKRPSVGIDASSTPLRVGSIRGIPGKDFPCYDEIPITSFSCAEKRVPGIYADLETGCQVFHVCWPNRRESFLCPIGTTFNQPITACDYWYSSNCSLSSFYLESTTEPPTKVTKPGCKKATCAPQTTESSSTEQHATTKKPEAHLPDGHPLLDKDWFRASKFVPVKTKVTVYFKHEDHSKHPSSKKVVSKTVIKQKHDIMPLVEEFLELTKTVAKDSIKLVPKVIKPKVTKSKHYKRPAAKLVPCLEIKDRHHKPTPSVVEEPKPLPTLNPRFIVKPVEVKKPLVKVPYEKKNKIVSPKVVVKHQPLSDHKDKVFNPGKDHASEIVLKALEMAGEVFQRDILAIARQAMSEDYKPKP